MAATGHVKMYCHAARSLYVGAFVEGSPALGTTPTCFMASTFKVSMCTERACNAVCFRRWLHGVTWEKAFQALSVRCLMQKFGENPGPDDEYKYQRRRAATRGPLRAAKLRAKAEAFLDSLLEAASTRTTPSKSQQARSTRDSSNQRSKNTSFSPKKASQEGHPVIADTPPTGRRGQRS